MDIKALEPMKLWGFFYDLTQIPRPSKNELRVIDYIEEFAIKRKLEYAKDEVCNIVVRKPASKGKEAMPTITLQSHVDMVPQKNSDKAHNFLTDPIETLVDGEWLTANGTTLGADNGIGVAAMLAVLDDKSLQHGSLECLFTIDEETGMTGAFGLKPGFLKGEILLNLDTEDEGELSVGCAGGLDATVTKKVSFQPAVSNASGLQISVKGLKGGHSGMDIHLGRANANKVMARLLNQLLHKVDLGLAMLQGGGLRNAIPREANAIINIPAEQKSDALALIDKAKHDILREFAIAEPDMIITCTEVEAPAGVIDSKDVSGLILTMVACPNGVMRMSSEMEGLVETSLNLASVAVEKGVFTCKFLLRSSVDSAKYALANRLMALFELIEADVQFSGDYPGWNPNMESVILQTMKKAMEKVLKQPAKVNAVHAGLECGIIGGVYPNMDMISFGPTIKYPHSPDEKVHIKSVERFWKLLCYALTNV